MNVQIFGVKGSADTRKALRYFAERRVQTHFVDLKQKPPSKRELQRFAQRYGVETLLDRDSKRFQNLGLSSAYLNDTRWLEKMMEEPLILKMPLARKDNSVTIGYAPDVWADWTERRGR